jgi:hypothetical protein
VSIRLILLLMSISGAMSGMSAQTAQGGAATALKTVILERSLPRPLLPDDPIKIVKVLLNGVEVKTGLHAYPSDKPGVPFHAGDDRFNHLTVVLKNISAKPIVYADTQILFAETASHSPSVIAAGNQAGERPRHARYSHGVPKNDAARPPILIEPGLEFSLPAIDPDEFGEVKQAIETRQPLSNITTISVQLGEVYFSDGTRWTGGVHYRPDLSAPGKYVVISQQEFDAYRQVASQ